jgi:GTP-binding protein
MVTCGSERSFVLADLPGLIEGAHAGVGLGHDFLRHVERTRVLVHLLEPAPSDGSEPLQNYATIRRELELHNPELVKRPEVLVVSKMDLTGSSETCDRIARELGRDILGISAATGQGLAELVRRIVQELDRSKHLETSEAPPREPPHRRDMLNENEVSASE